MFYIHITEFDDLNMTEPVYKTFSTFYSKCRSYNNSNGLAEGKQKIQPFIIITIYNLYYTLRIGLSLTIAAKFLYELCENNPQTDNKSIDLTNLMATLLLTHPHKSSSRLLPMFDVVMELGPNQYVF